MKKTIDITGTVMDRVVELETTRTTHWFIRFVSVIVSLSLFCGIVFLVIRQTILDTGSLELLEIFGEDKEVFAQYWQDVAWVFWEQLPQGTVFIGGLVLAALVGFLWYTRQTRKIMKKKMQQLATILKKK